MFSRLFYDENTRNAYNYDAELDADSEVSSNMLLDDLKRSINNVRNTRSTKNVNSIQDDLNYLEISKKRTEKLNMLFNAIYFIKNKKKNRLQPKKLDYILFLHDYFKRN